MYLKDIHGHVPLTTVADEIPGKVVDESVIQRQVCILNGELKIVVGLVQLVPEEEVLLAEFELLDVVLLLSIAMLADG